MSKFEKGTRVRFIVDLSTGDFSEHFPATGTEGTAGMSFCEYGDYHGVTVLFDDGRNIDVNEAYLEAVEDPYEYIVQTSRAGKDEFLSAYSWKSSLEEVEDDYKRIADAFVRLGYKHYTARIVKRRKAGPVEDV